MSAVAVVAAAVVGSATSRKWIPVETLVTGRWSSVYTTLDDKGRQLALKRVPLTEQYPIDTEGMILQRLKDVPNIIQLIDAQVHNGHADLLLEYAPGGTLEQRRIQSKVGFKEVCVRVYAYQILRALTHCHNHGIAHRDLKCRNILLTDSKDDDMTCKLADFGSALYWNAKDPDKSIVGPLHTTVAWTAPEALLPTVSSSDDSLADPFSQGKAMDIWSFGCTIVEMMTGRQPWMSSWQNDRSILYHRIQTSQKGPQIPNTYPVSGDIVSLLNSCFQINPQDRPTAEKLLSHPWFTKHVDSVIRGETKTPAEWHSSCVLLPSSLLSPATELITKMDAPATIKTNVHTGVVAEEEYEDDASDSFGSFLFCSEEDALSFLPPFTTTESRGKPMFYWPGNSNTMDSASGELRL